MELLMEKNISIVLEEDKDKNIIKDSIHIIHKYTIF